MGDAEVWPESEAVEKQAMGKSVDAVLEDIGQLGRFQISRLAMFCAIVFPPTFQLFNMFFMAAEPPWQCVANSTKCVLNGTFLPGASEYDLRCKWNRSDWEYAAYDGPRTSVITEFDLVCDDAVYGWLATSMVYIGTVTFTIPLSILSDRYGRLVTLFPCSMIILVVGFMSSFATQYWQFLITRFIIGSVVYGVLWPVVIFSAEFVGPRYRPLAQTITWFAFASALLLMALIAYFVRDWRTMMIFCTAPWIFILVFWKFIPESTRWYMTHNKVEKAENVLQQIAKVNKKEYPNEHLSVPMTSNKSLGFLALFSTRTLLISTLIQAFAWFVNGLIYYGASYGAGDLGGSMYLNFALVTLVEIPADMVIIDNCERFGRKKSVVVYMVLGGAACLIVSLIPGGTTRTDYIVGRVIGGMLGKGFITVSWDGLCIWSTELFPTVVRNSGLGFLGVLSQVGGVIAPFVVEMNRINPTVPFGLMGALAVAAAMLCLVLPETKGKPTAEVLEIENKRDGVVIISYESGENHNKEYPDTIAMTEVEIASELRFHAICEITSS